MIGKLIAIYPPSAIGTIFFFFGAVVIVFFINNIKIKYFIFSCFLIIVGFLFSIDFDFVKKSKITFFAIGQGDSALIETKSNYNFIIDGGGSYNNKFDPGEKIIIPRLNQKRIKKLDLVIISHPDPDHILGLLSIIKKIKIGEIWYSSFFNNHKLIKKLKIIAKKYKIKIKTTPEILGIHKFKDSYLEIIEIDKNIKLSNNNKSLLVVFKEFNKKVLFAGDIEKEAEHILISKQINLKADILKAPHHGSKSSSISDFIKLVSPKHTVFCTSQPNQWKFPHPQVVNRYISANSKIWDTGIHGEIEFILSENNIKIKPFRIVSCDFGECYDNRF